MRSESLESGRVPGLGWPFPKGDTVMPQLIILLASGLVTESSVDIFE